MTVAARLLATSVAFVALAACASTAPVLGTSDAAGTPPAATNKAAEALRQQQAQLAAPKPLTPEEKARNDAVAERSRQRTAAIMKQDFDTGYGFSTPAYRALYKVNHFRGRVEGVTAWRTAEVVDVSCDADDKCVVRVKVASSSFAGGMKGAALVTHVSEVWLRENNEWFFVEYR